MLYNSFQFIFGFLPACLILYFLAGRISRTLGNVVLTLMSLVFYAWWDWHNLPILLGSIVFNYAVGRRLRTHQKPGSPLPAWRWRARGQHCCC